ncbi:hypothetical protein RFI_07803, partial [Reticulomyxa filosa]
MTERNPTDKVVIETKNAKDNEKEIDLTGIQKETEVSKKNDEEVRVQKDGQDHKAEHPSDSEENSSHHSSSAAPQRRNDDITAEGGNGWGQTQKSTTTTTSEVGMTTIGGEQVPLTYPTLKKGIPTSSGEPSLNLPRRCEANKKCIFEWSIVSVCLILFIGGLLLMSDIQWYVRDLVDWVNTYDKIYGFASLFFAWVNTNAFLLSGVDFVLMMGFGFTFGPLIGTITCWVSSFVACICVWYLGRNLLRPIVFNFFNKYEAYCILDRCLNDYALLVDLH